MLIGKTLANLAKALACALTCNSMLWTLSQDREAAAAESACAEEPAAAPTPAVGVQWTHGARFTELDAAKPGNV